MLTVLTEPWLTKQGEEFTRVLRFAHSGTADDITNWDIDCDLRTDETEDVAVAAIITKRAPYTDGLADLKIVTEDLPARSYHFDVRAKIGSAAPKYYLEGVLEILPSYTRD